MIITLNKNIIRFNQFKLKCSVGKGGIKKKHKEGDNITPKGLFRIGQLYYRSDRLNNFKTKVSPEEVQTEIYELGKKYKYELKDWFLFLYEILLGQKSGPRLGTFVLLLSIKETVKLIQDSFLR